MTSSNGQECTPQCLLIAHPQLLRSVRKLKCIRGLRRWHRYDTVVSNQLTISIELSSLRWHVYALKAREWVSLESWLYRNRECFPWYEMLPDAGWRRLVARVLNVTTDTSTGELSGSNTGESKLSSTLNVINQRAARLYPCHIFKISSCWSHTIWWIADKGKRSFRMLFDDERRLVRGNLDGVSLLILGMGEAHMMNRSRSAPGRQDKGAR